MHALGIGHRIYSMHTSGLAMHTLESISTSSYVHNILLLVLFTHCSQHELKNEGTLLIPT